MVRWCNISKTRSLLWDAGLLAPLCDVRQHASVPRLDEGVMSNAAASQSGLSFTGMILSSGCQCLNVALSPQFVNISDGFSSSS